MFALPMETAAHPDTLATREEGDPRITFGQRNRPNDPVPEGGGAWYVDYAADTERKHRFDSVNVVGSPNPLRHTYANKPPQDPSEIINWVRVYKNPKTTPATDLTEEFHPQVPRRLSAKFPFWQVPNVATGPAYLRPSLHWEEADPMWIPETAIWVDFNTMSGDGSLLPDPAKDGESGLVTADKNTTVKPGDRVAIAVNITTWGGEVQSDLAIGPRIDIPYEWPYQNFLRDENDMAIRDAQGNQLYEWITRTLLQHEGVWRLNPNLALIAQDLTLNRISAGLSHTLVYQFVVDEEHAILNEGPWLKYDFVYEPDEGKDQAHGFDPTTGSTGGLHLLEGGPQPGNRRDPVDWLYGRPDGTLPSATAVKPWNTLKVTDFLRLDWGATATKHQSPGWTYHRYANHRDFTRSHRHIPMYEPEEKEVIFYPKVVVGNTDVTTVSTTTAITDVPTGTQTAEFQVTLGFSEVQEIADFTVERVIHQNSGARRDIPVPGASVSIFVAHDVSEKGVNDFKEELTTALAAADPPWTVTALTYAGGIKLASLEGHGAATRYTLTLSPPLDVKGDVALQIPAGVVSDAAGNPNVASETVMISVDTKTALPLAVVEPPEVVLGTGEVTVSVPFAQDGLTYEGDNPPYLTIYLGDEVPANARHAVWQSQSPGSTIVQFVYTGDDIGGLVTAKMALAIPKGTTLVVGTGPRAPRQAGNKPVASGPGEIGLPPPGTLLSVTDMSGAALSPVQPVLWLPTEESEPKAAASSVPRTPIVFNELGNGSGETNDWLELRNVTDASVSLKDWELSVVADAKQEDTSLVVFPDVSVPANGLLLLTNLPSDKTPLAGGDDVAAAGSDKRRKGLTHLSLVNAGLSLPDDGKFLLILRNAKEKRGLNEAFVDVAGGGGSGTDAFIREQTGLYDTHVWPLQVLESPGSNTEDSLSAGKVWLRAKADIVGYHRDAWAEAAFSGLGYDRKVSKSAETAGTPGYPNGAVKTEPATPKGAVTMSEVMFDSAGGTLPQWIELYNTSKTEALNLNRWELEIQNRKSEDLVGRPVVTLTLQEKMIQPNQTLLIVTGNARASSADVFPADRVYNLIELHEKNLRIKTPRDTFLSAKGFYLKLTDGTGALVDEIGNTDGDRRTDDNPAWALPVPLSEVEGMRSSLVRRYDNGVARDGTSREGWALAANFAKFKADGLHYGHAEDIGTPGYRKGGALPVELSSFTLTRTESGAVVVTWTTESEVDNAGFNLRRSLTRDSGYTLLNPALIAGAGTTGERQTYTFIDTSAKPGVEHYYQIEEVSFGGKPETLLMRRLRGPVSPAHRALKTLGEVKQAK